MGVYPLYSPLLNIITTFSHTRGSVPAKVKNSIRRPAFFPHTWEWSLLSDFPVKAGLLFPTQVGVILMQNCVSEKSMTFSHASGSDPNKKITTISFYSFFPRKWEWSAFPSKRAFFNGLFSTQVGVILPTAGCKQACVDAFPMQMGVSLQNKYEG